jgi:hypothetical protein
MSEDADDFPFQIGDEIIEFRIAQGPGLVIAYHNGGQYTGTVKLNLVSGESSVKGDDKDLIMAHGVLMWIAWVVIAPIGIFASRNRQIFSSPTAWFTYHRSLMPTAILVAATAAALAIVYVEDGEGEHFKKVHPILGLIVLCAAVTQPLNAYFRPHAPQPGETPTWARWIWQKWHKIIGASTVLLSWFTAYRGLLLYNRDATKGYVIAHWIVVACWILLFIVMEMVKCCQVEDPKGKPTRLSPRPGGENEMEVV